MGSPSHRRLRLGSCRNQPGGPGDVQDACAVRSWEPGARMIAAPRVAFCVAWSRRASLEIVVVAWNHPQQLQHEMSDFQGRSRVKNPIKWLGWRSSPRRTCLVSPFPNIRETTRNFLKIQATVRSEAG